MSSVRRSKSSALLRRHHVVDVHVTRETPFAGQRIIHDARLVGDLKPRRTQCLRQFARGDELAPVMSSPAATTAEHIRRRQSQKRNFSTFYSASPKPAPPRAAP